MKIIHAFLFAISIVGPASAEAPTVYRFDGVTGELRGAEPSAPSPLEPEVYIDPANSTREPPPAVEPGYARVFDGKKWMQVEDHRGTKIYSTDYSAADTFVTEIGPIPDGFTSKPPPSAAHIWNGAAWIEDQERKKILDEQSAATALREIDALSVRAIREAIIAQSKGEPIPADVKQELEALEAMAGPHKEKIDGKAGAVDP